MCEKKDNKKSLSKLVRMKVKKKKRKRGNHVTIYYKFVVKSSLHTIRRPRDTLFKMLRMKAKLIPIKDKELSDQNG